MGISAERADRKDSRAASQRLGRLLCDAWGRRHGGGRHACDLAVEFGTFAMTLNDKKGKPITENEKYVTTWKKQADGKWKVIADIWNTDK